jgi:Putative heavy-metal-binding
MSIALFLPSCKTFCITLVELVNSIDVIQKDRMFIIICLPRVRRWRVEKKPTSFRFANRERTSDPKMDVRVLTLNHVPGEETVGLVADQVRGWGMGITDAEAQEECRANIAENADELGANAVLAVQYAYDVRRPGEGFSCYAVGTPVVTRPEGMAQKV